MNHNLIQLIFPIAIPFILFHFFIKLLRLFTYETKRDVTKNEFNFDEIEIEENIPDVILSNNQFIKF